MQEILKKVKNKKFVIIPAIIILLLLIFTLAAAGYTNAWFTAGANTRNIFTTGTLSIEAIENNLPQDLNPSGCTQLNYLIENTGSKRSYVRARFDGYWVKGYHRNTATASVTYNDKTISASNSAYLKYFNSIPVNDPDSIPLNPTYGFTDEVTLPPYIFNPLSYFNLENVTLNNTELTEEEKGNEVSESDSEDFQEGPLALMTVISDYPEDCTGPLVSPISGSDLDQYMGNQPPDPDPVKLPSPETCNLISFKVEADQNDLIDGKTYTDGDLEVTIYKNSDNTLFAFEANYPVFHVYAKGSSDGGNLYMYYPAYNEGVYSDCGLSQPDGGWSHITFYYCIPEIIDDPNLTIIKQVSVDGGTTYFDADDLANAPVIDSDYDPIFKFVITNTGNVTLNNIEVYDDFFGVIGTINSLEPGSYHEYYVNYTDWEEDIYLSTENVSVGLCESMTGWEPGGSQSLGTYFYNSDILYPGDEVPLCVNICLDPGKTGPEYDQAIFVLYAYFEAVQVTNNMVYYNWDLENWPDN